METLLKDSAAIWGIVAVTMISVGMYIYNSSMNSIYSAADQISTQEQESFNSQWNSYEGAQSGASVKTLIGKIRNDIIKLYFLQVAIYINFILRRFIVMNRVYNFSAGPSMLPLDVLSKAAAELV